MVRPRSRLAAQNWPSPPLQLHKPAGLAVHGQALYIADTNNNCVVTVDLDIQEDRLFEIEGLVPPAPPAASRGL